MHFKAGKRDYSPLVKISLALVLALAMAAVGTASVNTPGVTAFLELDFPANVGFDNLPGGFLFDWANAGANTGACSEAGGTVTCSGSGGVFDGGTFNGPTTPPTAPTTTAAATAATMLEDQHRDVLDRRRAEQGRYLERLRHRPPGAAQPRDPQPQRHA